MKGFENWRPDPARVIGDTSKRRSDLAQDERRRSRVAQDDKKACVAYAGTQAPLNGRDASPRVQRLEVPAVAPSINQLYTMHHQRRGKVAKQFKSLVQIVAREQGIRPVEHYPVEVHVVCHFGPGRRMFDWENLALSAKFAGDGLRAAGIITNDSPAYVRLGTMEPRRTERESYTEFFIYEPR